MERVAAWIAASAAAKTASPSRRSSMLNVGLAMVRRVQWPPTARTFSASAAQDRGEKRILREGKLHDRFPADEMLLDDLFQHGRRAGVIPDRLGIHDRNRPLRAHAQAVDLGAIHERAGTGEFEFLEPALEVFPRFQTSFA